MIMMFFPKYVDCITNCAYRKQEYSHPDYKYTYAEEYHIENLKARTNEIFKEEIESGEIIKIEVEIVYAFYDEDPEYFLITLEYEKEFEVEISQQIYKTKYKHLMGFHQGTGQYYYGVENYTNYNEYGYRYGESPYHYLGYEDSKKYYGTYNFGIDENGIKKVVYRGANRTGIVGSAGPSESFEQYYPTKKQERNLMNAPRRWEKAIYKLRERKNFAIDKRSYIV